MQTQSLPNEKLSQQSLNRLIEAIIAVWEKRIRKEVVSAAEILRPTLRDAMPKFLQFLAQALSEKSSRGLLKEGSNLVRLHAGERARKSEYAPSEIIQEYQVLREIVTSQLEKELHLSSKDYETIQKTFDQTIQESLMEFFLVHTQLREQFTATLSHDLRNPLNVAGISAQLIQRSLSKIPDPKVREEFEQLVDKIESNLKRADRLIQDLLDASALPLGKTLPLQIKPCDLHRIVEGVVDEFEEKQKLRMKIKGESIQGYWDEERMQRAIENLVRNAIKYGDTTTPITIQFSQKGPRVQISIHNYGYPIPESDHEHIFEAFGRSHTQDHQTREGWGIGLAAVRAVSQAFGGTITVKSNHREGTTFTMDILRDVRALKRERFH